MKYTGMPWDIWTLITPLFRERCREEGTVRSFRCRHSGYRFDTSFLSPHYVYGVRKRWICIFDRWIRTPEINESVTFYSALSGSQSSK